MRFSDYFDDIAGQPYMTANNEIIIEISQPFLDMVEYPENELLNRNIKEVFGALRIGPNFNSDNIENQADYFLFTKSLDAISVNIDVRESINGRIYIFSEKSNPRSNIKFTTVEALYSHKIYGVALFSAPDITLLKANDTYMNFLDKPFNSRENSIGRKLCEIISGWTGSPSEDIWRNVLSEKKPLYIDEYMYKFERGVTYWSTNLTPVFEDDVLKYCIEITMDITEKVLNREKMLEQERIIEQQNSMLERELEDARLLQSISTELIYEDDVQKTYEKLIDAAVQIMHSQFATLQILHTGDDGEDRLQLLASRGFSPQAASFWQWIAIDSGSAYGEALRKGYPIGVANVMECDFFKGAEDEIIHLKTGINSVQTIPLHSRNGKLLGIMSTHWKDPHKPSERELRLLDVLARQAADLIERRQTEKELLEAEKEKTQSLEKAMEMKDEFLSFISHEFRTPLNVINAAVQAMNLFCANEISDKAKNYIEIIKQNTYRQLRLINNLLDMTRANAGRMKINKRNADIVSLTRSIADSVSGLAAQRGVELGFKSTYTKKIIRIDDEKYERIIMNLLSNAIKFTPEGKSIVVKLRPFKGRICVEVKDEGIGIPPERIDMIFDKFGQVDSLLSRRAEGAGIGLALTKKFVIELGGEISVKSKAGKGSTFTVYLPNEKATGENNKSLMAELTGNRLVETANIEFSDICL